jgi:N-acetylglucosaminyl-diphospho-decaprenol L-rhamnosyltransferase
MDLSIIVVNYNGAEELLRCLSALGSVRGEGSCEVIVVDNGSTDGSPDLAEKEYPWCRYIRAGSNLGFAAGCNLGLRQFAGRHALLLNPDTEVLPGTLSSLVQALDAHPSWGIVGPRMLDAKDRPYPAARRFPRPFDLFCETTRLTFCFPRSKLFSAYFYGDCDPNSLDLVDQIEGSALAISGPAISRVGLLDERFFIFFEEVDWCRRVRDAGFEIHILPSAQVRHFRSTTVGRNYVLARQSHARSAMAYFHKYQGISGLRSVRMWMRAGLGIRLIGTSLIAQLTGDQRARLRAAGARAELKVYRQGLET